MLDNKRLGKQRVETLQIVLALTGKNADGTPKDPAKRSWANHPIGRMWQGHVPALVTYQRYICFEWHRVRGYRDTCLAKTIAAAESLGDDKMPWWHNDEQFHVAHRSNLVRKFPEHYRPLFPDVPDNLPYLWPDASRPGFYTVGTLPPTASADTVPTGAETASLNDGEMIARG